VESRRGVEPHLRGFAGHGTRRSTSTKGP